MTISTNHMVLASVLYAASGAANAGLFEETFQCGNAFFEQHAPLIIDDDAIRSRQRFPTQNPNAVVSLRIEIEYFNLVSDPTTFASDLGMVIDMDGLRIGFGGSRGHLGAIAGGYSLGDALGNVDIYQTWDFDGPISTDSGVYIQEFFLPMPLDKAQNLNVFLTDTWNGNTEYRRVAVTTFKVPSPGTLALAGLGGLFAMRRRRMP